MESKRGTKKRPPMWKQNSPHTDGDALCLSWLCLSRTEHNGSVAVKRLQSLHRIVVKIHSFHTLSCYVRFYGYKSIKKTDISKQKALFFQNIRAKYYNSSIFEVSNLQSISSKYCPNRLKTLFPPILSSERLSKWWKIREELVWKLYINRYRTAEIEEEINREEQGTNFSKGTGKKQKRKKARKHQIEKKSRFLLPIKKNSLHLYKNWIYMQAYCSIFIKNIVDLYYNNLKTNKQQKTWRAHWWLYAWHAAWLLAMHRRNLR